MRLVESSKAFPEDLLWWEVTGMLSCCKLSVPSFISLIFVQILCLISTERQTIFHGFPAKYVDLCYWWNLSVINQAHSVDLEGKGLRIIVCTSWWLYKDWLLAKVVNRVEVMCCECQLVGLQTLKLFHEVQSPVVNLSLLTIGLGWFFFILIVKVLNPQVETSDVMTSPLKKGTILGRIKELVSLRNHSCRLSFQSISSPTNDAGWLSAMKANCNKM